MSDIELPAPDGTLRAYLALPADEAARPGVVVLHEAFGLTGDIRAHADRFAREGYVALAPDLFSWGATLRCLVASMRAVMRGEGRAFSDIEAARTFLAGHDRCDGRVGVIGFCMGGGFALACAAHGGFSVSAPNYGQVPRDAEQALAGACPVVASYGGRDRMLRGQAERLEAALTKLDVPHDVKTYPGATHSFMNRHRGPTRALDVVMRIRYDEAAAADAWRRILAFFSQHLDGTSRGPAS